MQKIIIIYKINGQGFWASDRWWSQAQIPLIACHIWNTVGQWCKDGRVA